MRRLIRDRSQPSNVPLLYELLSTDTTQQLRYYQVRHGRSLFSLAPEFRLSFGRRVELERTGPMEMLAVLGNRISVRFWTLLSLGESRQSPETHS